MRTLFYTHSYPNHIAANIICGMMCAALLICAPCHAQRIAKQKHLRQKGLLAVTTQDTDDAWSDFAEEYFSESGEQDDDNIRMYDELLEMHRQPININLARRDDLLKMPFLSDAQVDSILAMVDRLHGFYSMGELIFVKNLELRERKYLMLFFYCDSRIRGRNKIPDNKPSQPSAYTMHTHEEPNKVISEISSTFKMPLYKREGFRHKTPSQLEAKPNSQYLGNNISTTFRYRSSYANKLFWGLTAQKDEGEPFASHNNALYDSYSFYLEGKGARSIKQWIVGDYTAHFGLGLTVGASSVDANDIVASYRPRRQGFGRHTSSEEALFLRGGAINLEFGRFNVLAFASWRQLDATLKRDSITTILTNGYHRTRLEMSKRHNINALQGGVAIGMKINNLSIGIQSVLTHYDTPYITPTALYRKYYFCGKDFSNYSISYNWRKGPFALWGETALSSQDGLALQHRLIYSPRESFNLHLLHHHYDKRYLTTNGQSYKIGARLQNERGLMIGANWQPANFWTIRTWLDYTRFPFAIYRSKHASNALTAQAQAQYAPTQQTIFTLRYKYRTRGQDNKISLLKYRKQHYLKAQAAYRLGHIAMTSSIDATTHAKPDKGTNKGWMISQRAGINLTKKAFLGLNRASGRAEDDAGAPIYANALIKATQINICAAWFHTDSYDEALRLYEPTLLYASGIPSCYYHGLRSSFSFKHTRGKLSAAIKYTITHYTNRDYVGSGLSYYKGKNLQDVMAQIMIRF